MKKFGLILSMLFVGSVAQATEAICQLTVMDPPSVTEESFELIQGGLVVPKIQSGQHALTVEMNYLGETVMKLIDLSSGSAAVLKLDPTETEGALSLVKIADGVETEISKGRCQFED